MRSKNILIIIIGLILIINILFIIISLNPNILGNVINSESSKTTEPGFVSKIIDGDTVIIGGVSTRLLGIDTDERGYPCYSGAKKRIEELVLNKEVQLEKDGEDIDQYKRNLRYIFLDNKNINLQLVEEGLAVARFSPENKKYKDEILNAEVFARENKIGCKWEEETKKDIISKSVSNKSTSKGDENSLSGGGGEGESDVEEKYVGSKNSNKYHKPDCRWVKKISKENLIYFETKEEAEENNYIGCKTCIE